MAVLDENRKGDAAMKKLFAAAGLFVFSITASAQDGQMMTLSPPEAAASETSGHISSAQKTSDIWDREPLRDPFWPVGFYPDGWQKKTVPAGEADLNGSGWKSASGRIRIGGTSRLGGRTAAIINGDLKSVGDQIEVLYEGKTYQWQIIEIDAEGRIQLKKLGIR